MTLYFKCLLKTFADIVCRDSCLQDIKPHADHLREFV